MFRIAKTLKTKFPNVFKIENSKFWKTVQICPNRVNFGTVYLTT